MTNCNEGTAGTVHPECIGERHYSDEHGTGSAIKMAKAPDVDMQKDEGGAMPDTSVQDALEKASGRPDDTLEDKVRDDESSSDSSVSQAKRTPLGKPKKIAFHEKYEEHYHPDRIPDNPTLSMPDFKQDATGAAVTTEHRPEARPMSENGTAFNRDRPESKHVNQDTDSTYAKIGAILGMKPGQVKTLLRNRRSLPKDMQAMLDDAENQIRIRNRNENNHNAMQDLARDMATSDEQKALKEEDDKRMNEIISQGFDNAMQQQDAMGVTPRMPEEEKPRPNVFTPENTALTPEEKSDREKNIVKAPRDDTDETDSKEGDDTMDDMNKSGFPAEGGMPEVLNWMKKSCGSEEMEKSEGAMTSGEAGASNPTFGGDVEAPMEKAWKGDEAGTDDEKINDAIDDKSQGKESWSSGSDTDAVNDNVMAVQESANHGRPAIIRGKEPMEKSAEHKLPSMADLMKSKQDQLSAERGLPSGTSWGAQKIPIQNGYRQVFINRDQPVMPAPGKMKVTKN